jgi:hypothetical protein
MKKIDLIGFVNRNRPAAAVGFGGAAVALIAVAVLATSGGKAMAIDVTMGNNDNLADRLGTEAGLSIGEHCGLPVEMGIGRSSADMVRRHMAIDPNFTKNVSVRVIVKPGDRFIIDERGRVSCPADD